MDGMITNPWVVLVLGMGTVFASLLLLVLIIKVMGLIAGKTVKTPAAPAAAAKAAPAPVAAPAAAPAAPAPAPVVYPHEVDRYAFDAAVAAAIAAYTGRDIKGFRITRITKI